MTGTAGGVSPDHVRHRDEQGAGSDQDDCFIPGQLNDAALTRGELRITIETEIIPRLLMAHRVSATYADDLRPRAPDIVFTDADVEAFCGTLLNEPLVASRNAVERLLRGGMALDAVIASVMAPSARHLGAMWEQDRCTFVDVTLGVPRLQQLLRIYGTGAFDGAAGDLAYDGVRPRVLLCPAPGEQHTFGLSIIEEHFLRAGWQVSAEVTVTTDALLVRVRDEWFDVLGLSVSGEVVARNLADTISAVRAASLNDNLCIVLGGVQVTRDALRSADVGAYCAALDAPDALQRVQAFMRQENTSC